MGCRYSIMVFNYPWDGMYKASYRTQFFINFAIKLFIWNIKYDGLTIEARKPIQGGIKCRKQ